MRVVVVTLWALSTVTLTAQAAADCFDGRRDDTEAGVDCGGACKPCDVGDACGTWRDCSSGRCAEGTCEERPYDGGDVPSGYDLARSERDAPATARHAGVLLFASGYAVAYVAALAVPTDNAVLFVPVYGPWAMATRDGQENPGLLVADAVVQTVGVTLLLGGIFGAGRQLVRAPAPPPERAERRPPPVRIAAAPTPAGWAVALTGGF